MNKGDVIECKVKGKLRTDFPKGDKKVSYSIKSANQLLYVYTTRGDFAIFKASDSDKLIRELFIPTYFTPDAVSEMNSSHSEIGPVFSVMQAYVVYLFPGSQAKDIG
jgi:hypothetical protein